MLLFGIGYPNKRLCRLFGDCFAFARNDENGCLKGFGGNAVGIVVG
ncbi:MAG: hypothetical protein IJV35_07460 [Neisseriaceae bacterium]|nr:hypothetical protein [Neisseriaceae bacterium]